MNLLMRQVFTKMRYLHNELDRNIKQKKKKGTRTTKIDRKLEYINDCTKMIMDAQVPDAVISGQILVRCQRKEKEHKDTKYYSFRRTITSEAVEIAKQAARELHIP